MRTTLEQIAKDASVDVKELQLFHDDLEQSFAFPFSQSKDRELEVLEDWNVTPEDQKAFALAIEYHRWDLVMMGAHVLADINCACMRCLIEIAEISLMMMRVQDLCERLYIRAVDVRSKEDIRQFHNYGPVGRFIRRAGDGTEAIVNLTEEEDTHHTFDTKRWSDQFPPERYN